MLTLMALVVSQKSAFDVVSRKRRNEIAALPRYSMCRLAIATALSRGLNVCFTFPFRYPHDRKGGETSRNGVKGGSKV